MKDFKHRLGGRKRKPDGPGANTAGERADSPNSLSRPESRATASGHEEEGSGITTGGGQARPKEQSPHPEPVPGDGGDDDQKTKEEDVKVAVDSGPGREVEQVYPSPSTPSVPPKGQSDGM